MTCSINPFTFNVIIIEREKCLLLLPIDSYHYKPEKLKDHLYHLFFRVKKALSYNLNLGTPLLLLTTEPVLPSCITNTIVLAQKLDEWFKKNKPMISSLYSLSFYESISLNITLEKPTSSSITLENTISTSKMLNPKKRWIIKYTLEAQPFS
ncbi:hypothetical protein CLAVI_000901 [Candidatus Clavichlamydia salmonicola]|uniref:hypothetical protein n=1 Tax=Candidatus Clavichlamydia salmonicola TaxID=469812 RepID=UPI0018910AA0|nr:hypothetical protein [Candidatus Clavichlamydia salmonicola]MBF5051260.1 hypothetical protein [Candidatus Clavichlamydia salmonicola]